MAAQCTTYTTVQSRCTDAEDPAGSVSAYASHSFQLKLRCGRTMDGTFTPHGLSPRLTVPGRGAEGGRVRRRLSRRARGPPDERSVCAWARLWAKRHALESAATRPSPEAEPKPQSTAWNQARRGLISQTVLWARNTPLGGDWRDGHAAERGPCCSAVSERWAPSATSGWWCRRPCRCDCCSRSRGSAHGGPCTGARLGRSPASPALVLRGRFPRAPLRAACRGCERPGRAANPAGRGEQRRGQPRGRASERSSSQSSDEAPAVERSNSRRQCRQLRTAGRGCGGRLATCPRQGQLGRQRQPTDSPCETGRCGAHSLCARTPGQALRR